MGERRLLGRVSLERIREVVESRLLWPAELQHDLGSADSWSPSQSLIPKSQTEHFCQQICMYT